jgi:hypothetical protein
MSKDTPEQHATSGEEPSLTESFCKIKTLVSTDPLAAIPKLEELQRKVDSLALFSSNECIDDVSTSTLSLLALDHYLALAYSSVPTGLGMEAERKSYLLRSMDHSSRFLQRLEELDIISKDNKAEFDELLQINLNEFLEGGGSGPLPPVSRERKIERFRSKKELQNQLEQLKSLQQRRNRLDIGEDEEIDGNDSDSLMRSLAIKEISLCETEAIDEWQQALRELPLVLMQLKMKQDRQRSGSSLTEDQHRLPPPLNTNPLQVTHITQDAVSGKLNIRKEEIRAQVFRPSWNQPTMTLAELGEREVKDALERQKRQEESEKQNKNAPRRYEQLVQDGMDDNAELVDASAQLDRQWDDWKEENPRGSGNKMGDRGDRNF